MNDENNVNGSNTVSEVPTSTEEVVNNYGGTTGSNDGAYTSGVQNGGPSVFGGDYAYNQNSSNEKKDPALKIFLGIIAVVVVVALVGVGVFAITSGGKNEFEKVFGDDYLFGMQVAMAKEIEKSDKNTVEVSVNADEILSKLGTDKIGLNEILLRESTIKDGKNLNDILYLIVEDKEVASLKLAKTENLYGIVIPGLVDKYIAIEDGNLKELAEKFGADEETIEMLPNSLEEYVNQNGEVSNKYKDLFDKYLKLLSKDLNQYMKTENDVELKIDGTSYKTKKYSVSINEKNLSEILIDILRMAEKDKELFDMFEEEDLLANLDVETYDEWKEKFGDLAKEGEEAVANDEMDEDEVLFVISAYTYKNDTLGLEFAMEEEDLKFSLVGQNDNKESYLALLVDTDEDKVGVTFTQTKENKEYKGKVSANLKSSGVTIELDLCDVDVIVGEAKGLDKLETISKSDVFLINDATEEELEDKLDEIGEASSEYLQGVIAKLPESLQNSLTELLNGSSNKDYDNDYDYDYDDNDNYVFYNKPGDFKLEGTQVEVLSDLQDKYNKVKIGMTESELTAVLGKEDSRETYGDWSFLEWNNDSDTGSIVVSIGEEKVDSKEISVYSSSYDNVMLSKELNSTLEDLPTKITSIKEGMTLDEVKAILGNASFESEVDDYGATEITWYDTAENYVSITFEDNKVDYIGSILGAY